MSIIAALAGIVTQQGGAAAPPPTPPDTTFEEIVGTYSSATLSDESFVAFVPGEADPSLKPAVLYMHGSGANQTQMQLSSNTNLFYICRGLAYAGHVVLSFNCSGNHWGNSESFVRINEAIAYAQGTLGAKPDWQVAMIGGSMGGCGLAWAGQPANAGGLATFVGLTAVSDTQSVYDENASLQGQMDAAFGGTYDNATDGPDHNPLLLAQAGRLDGIAARFYYGDQDAVVLPSTTLALAAAFDPPGQTQAVAGYGHDAINGIVPYADEIIQFVTSRPGVAVT